MKKILTIIYPVYSYRENEIKNIIFLQKKLEKNDDIDIVVLSDNPKINSELKAKLHKSKVVESKRNLGKYQLIKNYADSGNLKSIWYKVVDPDDIILIKELKTFVNFAKNIKIDDTPPLILLTELRSISTGDYDACWRNLNRLFQKKVNRRNKTAFTNQNSILPSISLMNFDLEAIDQTKSSDILLSLSHFVQKEPKVVEYGETFYLYNRRRGITGTKVYDELLLEQQKKFLIIMKKYKKWNKTSSPNIFVYKWSHNMILESGYDINKQEEQMKDIFFLLKDATLDKWFDDKEWDSTEILEFRRMLKHGEKFIL